MSFSLSLCMSWHSPNASPQHVANVGLLEFTARCVLLSAVGPLLVLSPVRAASPAPATSPATNEVPIFDGKSLDGWRVIEKFDFQDHGKVEVREGVIYLPKGKPATGISWKSDLPRSNYQLSFQGQRVEGSDFFCGLTFPVKTEYCTLILGGWGGQVIGLSNIDGFSAIENETTQAMDFEQGKWYAIELTVRDERITVRIDHKQVIDVATEGHKFSIWWEQEPVTPLGLVTWHTTGAIKQLKLNKLDPRE